MEVKKDIRNDLLKRQELVFLLESDKAPSFEEVRKKISEEFKKPEEVIDLFNVRSGFGKNVFEITTYIYDSKEDLEKILEIRKTKKQRKQEAEANKKSEEEARAAAESKESEKSDSESKEKPEEKSEENKQ
ncbi:hypothetical protein GF386_05700 [Candidatus Pacearchaeota archaeon]|nr:hypothetical protein [Candidatus Pacearchaeota archaeon]MBD3283588.1 hypothetical protein [Candidatus Pacearchaeota archaeon]